MTAFQRSIASFLIASTTALGLPPMAQAGLVGTAEAVATEASQAQRDKVQTFLARDDVRQALVAQGLSPELARERVQALSDAEVAQLADRVDSAPAGGEILGILLTVFLVLLFTDIMGFTKVFSFTRSVR